MIMSSAAGGKPVFKIHLYGGIIWGIQYRIMEYTEPNYDRSADLH